MMKFNRVILVVFLEAFLEAWIAKKGACGDNLSQSSHLRWAKQVHLKTYGGIEILKRE